MLQFLFKAFTVFLPFYDFFVTLCYLAFLYVAVFLQPTSFIRQALNYGILLLYYVDQLFLSISKQIIGNHKHRRKNPQFVMSLSRKNQG